MEFTQRDTLIFAILVLFLGQYLTRKINFLKKYNIPEPVSGGALASLFFALVYLLFDKEISFDLSMRDTLLVAFFTTIGLSANFSDLLKGGRTLGVLLLLASIFLVFQNLLAVGVAAVSGYPLLTGLLGGSMSLSGGHGTAIAWAPEFIQNYGFESAMEVGIAVATFGLVFGGLLGGPVARYLMQRHELSGSEQHDVVVGVEHEDEPKITLQYDDLLRTILIISIASGIGVVLQGALVSVGVKLPDFVTALFAGILLTNTVPRLLPAFPWPHGTAAMALVSDLSLGLFLAMSLMSMQLWTIFVVAGPIILLMLVQAVAVLMFAVFVIYRFSGRDYQAAVIASGYVGMSLGATPTAVANMSAVTKQFGAAPLAFIVIPLIGAFFIDLANAIVINGFLSLFG